MSEGISVVEATCEKTKGAVIRRRKRCRKVKKVFGYDRCFKGSLQLGQKKRGRRTVGYGSKYKEKSNKIK